MAIVTDCLIAYDSLLPFLLSIVRFLLPLLSVSLSTEGIPLGIHTIHNHLNWPIFMPFSPSILYIRRHHLNQEPFQPYLLFSLLTPMAVNQC